MADLSNGLKCKYCAHYRSSSCSSSGVCLRFRAAGSDLDMMARAILHEQTGKPLKRADGSYIVELDDVPSVKNWLLYQEEEKNRNEKRKMIIIICLALVGCIIFCWPVIELFLDIFFWLLNALA